MAFWSDSMLLTSGNPEVIAPIAASRGKVILRDLFSSTIWGDANIDKKVIINPSVTVSTDDPGWAIAATYTGDVPNSWAGSLILENYGTISGRGGNINGGAGGTAIWVNHTGRFNEKLIIKNMSTGIVRGGGGGGGAGGQGGPGFWDEAYNFWEGPMYDRGDRAGAPMYAITNGDGIGVYWNSSSPIAGSWATPHSVFNGNDGWQYHRGVARETTGNSGDANGTVWYEVSRVQTRYTRHYTTGGAGGAGGRGQGGDVNWQNGVAGSPGGTNAGTGGTGGRGGDWGNAGWAGGVGGGGNNGGGAGGQTGGLGGCYVSGSTNAIISNSGSLVGRLA